MNFKNSSFQSKKKQLYPERPQKQRMRDVSGIIILEIPRSTHLGINRAQDVWIKQCISTGLFGLFDMLIPFITQ